MEALKGAIAVLPAPPCKDGAIAISGLTFEIDFCSPICRYTIFKLHPRCAKELLPGARRVGGGRCLNIQISRLFQMMVISHEIRALLCAAAQGCQQKKPQETEPHGFLQLVVTELQVGCLRNPIRGDSL